MIEKLSGDNIEGAAEAYSRSWRASHKDICSAGFLLLHDGKHMAGELSAAEKEGSSVYVCLGAEGKPVGIVSVSKSDLISLLYVAPEEQGKGFGKELLRFAVGLCNKPWLTVLSTNERAIRLYEEQGFVPTGEKSLFSEEKQIYELKYVYQNEKL